MDVTNMSEVWAGILSYAESCTDKPGYSHWLRGAKLQTMTDNTFEIGVANNFIKNWIETKYADDMTQMLTSLCEKPMQLIVTNLDIVEEAPANIDNLKPIIQNSVQTNLNIPIAAPIADIGPTNLIEKYTFDNFIKGNSNRIAAAAALAVAENPANTYNPLFLYSNVGLGKTHLMHAIGNHIKKNHPEMKILYLSSESFTNDLINSIQKGNMEEFRKKYRNIDVLLIDDIQFLRKKDATQEEFFHTFNSLRDANKQIIISSDRSPKELTTLDDRLRSRFEWGLTVDIQPPDYETRMAILRNMAEKDHLELPSDVILFIAQSIESNIREIEGAYTKVTAFTKFDNSPITMESAKKALAELGTTINIKLVSAQEIQQVVCNHYKIKVDDLLSKKRTRNLAFPRQVAMYLCRELTDYSLPKIGDLFGGRDHTTVIHACEKISKESKSDPILEKTIKELTIKLKN